MSKRSCIDGVKSTEIARLELSIVCRFASLPIPPQIGSGIMAKITAAILRAKTPADVEGNQGAS